MRNIVCIVVASALLAACASPEVSSSEGSPPSRQSRQASSTTCEETPWTAGTSYVTGDIVSYEGDYYVATHDNPGYDPTISTWFWDPKDGCVLRTAPPAGACNAVDWQAGRPYGTGDVVSFDGGLYVATHDNPGYDPTISTWFWDPYTCSPDAPDAPGATSATAFERLLSRSVFESMFRNRNGFYTYDGLVEATKTYPAFASTGTTDDQKRELAAFLGNVNHETGALVYIEEINKSDYCLATAPDCPCAPGKQYFGRGPLQLSWNYNYCSASESIFGDKNVLRLDPDRITREARVAWATALYFWMTSIGAGTMTAHDGMMNGGNFGETIRTINGTLECGGRAPDAVQSRAEAYRRFCMMLGVDPGTRTSC